MGTSFSNFLLNGTPPPNTTTGSSTTSNLPGWYNSYLASIATAAAGIAGQDYQPYQGQRIASVDPQQRQAYDYLGAHANDWQSPLAAGSAAASRVAGGFDPSQFQQYMNPYTSGVTNEIQRLGLRNLNENLLPTLNSQFVESGQFGSTRNGDMAERLVRDVGADITGKQAGALESSFKDAMGNYVQGQGVVNQAANNLGGLAQMQRDSTIGTAGALSASGQTMQQQQQAGLDVGYQDWLNQINFPRQNIAFLGGALNGSNITPSTSTVKSEPAPAYSGSPLATIASSVFGGLGNPTNPARPVRHGGYIRLASGGSPLEAVAASSMPKLMRVRRPVAGAGMRGAGGLSHLRMAA